ncbi:MAG: AI-2E family transporter [Deltaproteobacteria bacterium]|nr:AI-2E family transporter [Deltaproteobacteria bacterium]
MQSEISRDYILWYFLGLFIVSILLLGWLLWPFISILILAAVVTQLFSPVYAFITIKDKITPPFASLLTCLLIFLILFVPIVLFVGILSKEAYDLYLMAKNAVISDQLKDLIQNSRLIEKANQIFATFNIRITGEELNSAITELGKIVGLFLYKQASAVASNIFVFLVNFFFMLLVIYYLLIDGGRLISYIIDLSPLPADQDKMLIQKFKDMAGAVLIGNGVGGLIQGTLGGIVFSLFGLKSPFLWGVIMGLLAFLPIIGIGVVFLPTAIYLFLKGRIAAGIFFIVFYVILSGSVEYLFKPKLVGERVKMHTLIVFLSIIGGLKLFGILGIIYGPLIMTAFLTLSDIYHNTYRARVEPAEE